METEGRRVSERIELELSIEVGGTDCMGFQFFETTRTLVLSRHGGKIVLKRKLAPQEEVIVRSLASGREAEARIIGQIGESEGSYFYGIKFLNDEANIWDIEFPPAADAKGAIGRVTLQCLSCSSREIAYLDDFELEVLEANGQVSRPCKRCRDVSLWRKALSEGAEPEVAAAPAPPAVPTQLQSKREDQRHELKVTACVRSSRVSQDLVEIRNVSPSGICFTSPCDYAEGEAIEVALPYSPGGGNVFLPAKIVWLQFQEPAEKRTYGVCYLHFPEGA